MNQIFYSAGLNFQCQQCHSCCRHDPGYVFLSKTDLDNIAEYFKVTVDDVIKKYCSFVNLGITNRISLIEKKNFDCIFWDNGCTIYKVRPLQCKSFPFWPANLESKESWDRVQQQCPGVNIGKLCTCEEIQLWQTLRSEQAFLTVG